MTMSGFGQERKRARRAPRPLDSARLDELALAYVARFATSAGKLERYLARKLRERGWEGEGEPDPAGIARRCAELGYLDDAAYAHARGGDLLRRGYGGRRVAQALGEAGIAEDLRREVAPGEGAARRAAFALARRRRLGPFPGAPLDRAVREKQFAALVRAGHGFDHAGAVVDAPSEAALEQWVAEADDDQFQ
jgi:regulatory protein